MICSHKFTVLCLNLFDREKFVWMKTASGLSGLTPNWVQSQNVLKLILKSAILVLFRTNLTQFAKPNIHGQYYEYNIFHHPDEI